MEMVKGRQITRSCRRGMTLIEITVASIIGLLVAGGTMTAFLLAVKTSRSSLTEVDAAALAQQTIEKLRNNVACDSTWFDVNCQGLSIATTSDDLQTDNPDDLITKLGGTRAYTVTPWDCINDQPAAPGTDTCSKVEVKVEWTPPQ